MTPSYNPFEILSLPTIRRLVQQGNHCIVLQRFNWPGLKEGCAFIATPYLDQAQARQHQKQLEANEGKLLNLPADIEKITNLINGSQYYIFLSTFREDNWHSRILKHYQNNIISFLKAGMSVDSGQAVGINLRLQYGRLKATITSNASEYEFDVYELVK